MGKTKTTIINRFDGGLASDRRVNQSNKFSVTKHFDAFKYQHKLVPHIETVAFGDADEEAKNIIAFVVATQSTSTAVWGLGKGVADRDKIAVYYASGQGLTGGWIAPTDSQSTIDYSELENPKILFAYKDKLYTFADARLIVFSIGGAWDNAGTDFGSVTSVAPPVHHPADDIAYFFYNNIVGKIDGAGAFEDDVLTLPSNLKIVSSCPYGNYLAIGCVTKDSIDQKSTVFLWDRDSSLTTVSQQIDFGKGAIKKLANLNGKLTAVMDYHLVSATATGIDCGSVRIKQSYQYNDKAVLVNEIFSDSTSNVSNYAITDDDKIYITMAVEINGDERYGIWAIDSNGNATLDFVENSITNIVDGNYNGIFKTGNVWWIAHSDDGSIGRTRTTGGSYLSTTLKSIYESLIFDEDDNSKTKKFLGITLTTEALPSNGSIVLQYRKDEDLDDATAWTTILTHSGEDEIRSSAINIAGATLPTFKEIQFRLESKQGAVPTSIKFKTTEIEDDIY